MLSPSPNRPKISPARARVLGAVHDLAAARRGLPPTVQEVADHVGLRSTATVMHHLRCLEETGHVTRANGSPRARVLTEEGFRALLRGETPLASLRRRILLEAADELLDEVGAGRVTSAGGAVHWLRRQAELPDQPTVCTDCEKDVTAPGDFLCRACREVWNQVLGGGNLAEQHAQMVDEAQRVFGGEMRPC